MRPPITVIPLLLISFPALGLQAEPEPDAQSVMDSYRGMIDRNCPGQHLDWLSGGDLNHAIENLEQALPSPQKNELERLADVQSACTATIAGIGCANVAYLRALTKLNLLPMFVERVCRITCVGPS